MEINSIKKDSSLISEGAWVGDIQQMGDLMLRVRGLTSPLVIALRSRKERGVLKDEREIDGSLKPDASMRIFAEVLHEAVLLDWSGMTENGELLPFDKDRAGQWIKDPDFRSFADAVTYAASVVDNGNGVAREELAGNSAKLSSGKSKTTA